MCPIRIKNRSVHTQCFPLNRTKKAVYREIERQRGQSTWTTAVVGCCGVCLMSSGWENQRGFGKKMCVPLQSATQNTHLKSIWMINTVFVGFCCYLSLSLSFFGCSWHKVAQSSELKSNNTHLKTCREVWPLLIDYSLKYSKKFLNGASLGPIRSHRLSLSLSSSAPFVVRVVYACVSNGMIGTIVQLTCS